MRKILAGLLASALVAGTAHAAPEPTGTFVNLQLVTDTSIYADGDVLSDTKELTRACRTVGGNVTLQSIEVLDADDQGIALDVVILDTNSSLGTFNAAPTITDANNLNIVGRVNIATGDYIDNGGNRVANKAGINMRMKCSDLTNSLFVATITRGGTPTYTASGLVLRIGFTWD